MKSASSPLPPKAAELFKTVQNSYQHTGISPLVTQRKAWLAFLLAVHQNKSQRLTGNEFYEYLANDLGWRNDVAQGAVAEYDLAKELLDLLHER